MAFQDQAMDRAVTRHRFRAVTRSARRITAGAATALAVLLPLGYAGAASAQASVQPTTFHVLNLINGWTNAPFGTSDAEAASINGIVHFKGAIATTGTNEEAFVLPTALRPAKTVYVPVDLCNATNGRLIITPNGHTSVEAEGGNFSNAQCFTSLDGASFAKSPAGFTNLALQNGWTNAPFATSNAAAEVISGIVHFKGAIATTGTNPAPFTLPKGFRPARTVYVQVDLCGATNGRLVISPNGQTSVEAEGGNFGNAQCFTSLDGASFAKSAAGFTNLKLKNGWTTTPFGTSAPAAENLSGVVQLKGAIETSGTNSNPFRLPVGDRPATEVFIPVDMCNATNGRLDIAPSGQVSVEAETDFSNASCFTSLDGASFIP